MLKTFDRPATVFSTSLIAGLLLLLPRMHVIGQLKPPKGIDRQVLAAGMTHALAIRTDSTVWSLGANHHGQMGVGWSSPAFIQAPIRLTNIIGAVAVAAGSYHSLVLDHNQRVWAFGYNDHWQLGPVATNRNDQPVPKIIPNLDSVIAIDAGSEFSMGVMASGKVKAWGDNSDGQLGIGSVNNNQNIPTEVIGLSDILQISCGFNHALALASNGTVWAWGANKGGQLGLGFSSDQSSNVPVRITNLTGICAVAAGKEFSVALRTNGIVYVWGNNSAYRLGVTNILNRSTSPIVNPHLTNIWQIRAASHQGYAIDTSLRVFVWGQNGAVEALGLPSSIAVQHLPVLNTNFVGFACLDAGGNLYSSEKHVGVGIDTNRMLCSWGMHTKDLSNPILKHDLDFGYGDSTNRGYIHPFAHVRGSGEVADFVSFVIPLDLPKNAADTNLTNTNYSLPVGYHFNSTNSHFSGQQDNHLRIPYAKPIVHFGLGGEPLYAQRSYRFVIYAGAPSLTNTYDAIRAYESAIQLDVIAKSNACLIGSTNIPIPFHLSHNEDWEEFLGRGLSTAVDYCGLKTFISIHTEPFAYGFTHGVVREPPNPQVLGVTNAGLFEVKHIAADIATNFIFLIKVKGVTSAGWVATDETGKWTWQPLYAVAFSPATAWYFQTLGHAHFHKEPMPFFRKGSSLAELLTNAWAVTNTVGLESPMSNFTNVDGSPELRSHPILDDFVKSLNRSPLQLARFVFNEIEVVDAMDISGHSQIAQAQLNLGGINRSALSTFLERQGSPLEQCALLTYLLRRAGVPTVYMLPPKDGIKLLDDRVSKMLRLQVAGAIDPSTLTISTNRLLSLNYAWVAAYINDRWVHLFPWLKDTEIVQGLKLYDYLPEKYDTAMNWLVGYIRDDPAIVGLGSSKDSPEVLFPLFVEQQMARQGSGLSIQDFGVRTTARKPSYNSFEDLPTPTWVAGTSLVANTLSDAFLTNASFRNWNSNVLPSVVFNLASVDIVYDGQTRIASGQMRICDLLHRPLFIYHDRTNGKVQVNLALARYRPGSSTIGSFTNDSFLTNAQKLSFKFPDVAREFVAKISLTRFSASGEEDIITRELAIAKGDLNAICLSVGRVSREMLEPLAQEIWRVEREIKANSEPQSLLELSHDRYQGPLAYLVGMSYYQKSDRFMALNRQLHCRAPITSIGIGAAKLLAKKSLLDSDGLPDGEMRYFQPAVDMVFHQRTTVDALSARPDLPEPLNPANSGFDLLALADASAKEHDVINSFFKDSDGVSTVRLLQMSTTNVPFKGPLAVSHANLWDLKYLKTNYAGNNYVTSYDEDLWKRVEQAVLASPQNQAFITPGRIWNTTKSYLGMAALIITRAGYYGALIGQANGGWGSSFAQSYSFEFPFQSINLINASLGVDWLGNYSVDFYQPSYNYRPLAEDSFAAFNTANIVSQSQNQYLTYSPYHAQWASQTAGCLNISGSTPSFAELFAADVLHSESRAVLGWLSDGMAQEWCAVMDPVHAVSGEFYVDAADLSVIGPLSLEVRRNYSSLNLADNQFGIGWKLAFTPYMSVTTNEAVMYAAEPDGSVLAYETVTNNSNLWVPTCRMNPHLVNNRTDGIGATANLLLSRIQRQIIGQTTNFFLLSPNGDTRVYKQMDFSISNVVQRVRPYLVRWEDNRGNSLHFAFGTNLVETDYGELRRVESSSGAYVNFRYDVYGHIVEAFSGDGRHLKYEYDEFGDLVRVLLPDNSEMRYEYARSTATVTNKGKVSLEPISLHQLVKEIKPDGRILFNVYDDQRRIVLQASTVGPDLNLVTNATFTYANDFVLTNAITNTITGQTEITDVFGKVTRYQYSQSRITNVVDPLRLSVEQHWYADDTGPPGYPRSLWKRKDKRGLWTEFFYDQHGNVTNLVTSGNLTGEPGTQVASHQTLYNTNNLPVVVIDAVGNSNVYRYHPVYPFLPEEIVAYSGGQVVTSHRLFYGNATNVFTYGAGYWTNVALGLLQKAVRAWDSPDAATNQWIYDGRGFVTAEIAYPGGGTAPITNWLAHNDRGELFERVTPSGHRFQYDRDLLGRFTTEKLFAPGQATPLSWNFSYYNANGELTWSDGPRFDPEDYVWRDYDGAGRLIVEARWRSRAKADGSGVEAEPGDALYSITAHQYDPAGNRTNTIDPRGHYQAMAYDPVGQLTQAVFYAADGAALATNRFGYEPGGEVAAHTNALGGVTLTAYTQAGQPFRRVHPDGSTNGWTYYLDGRPRREFNPNGAFWETVYDDAQRRVIRLFRDADGTLLAGTTNQYDRRGNSVTNSSAEGATLFSVYDGLDRVIVAGGPPTVPGLSTQQVSRTYYDPAGLGQTNDDALGGRRIERIDPLQRSTSLEIRDAAHGNALLYRQATVYGSNHHSVTTVNGTGPGAVRHTTYTDTFGRPVLERSFANALEGQFSRSTYDAAGNLVEARDELGQATTSVYDALNRLQSRRLPDGAQLRYTHNAEGGLTSMSLPGGLRWSATYDAANRRTSEQLNAGAGGPAGRHLTNLYFASGPFAGLAAATIDLGRSITNSFSYDAFLRLTTNSAAGAAPEHALVTILQHDREGRLTNQVQVSALAPATAIRRGYDGYGQLTNEQVYLAGALHAHFDQSWDAARRRARLETAGARYDYAYHADNQLAAVNAFGAACGYHYSDNGLLAARVNPWRSRTVRQRDNRGRPLVTATLAGAAGSNAATALLETFSWRDNSDLATYAAARSGNGAWNEQRSYAYNARNELKAQTLGLAPNVSATAQYGFDAQKLGVRTSQTLAVSGGGGGGGGGNLAHGWSAAAGSPDPFGRILRESVAQGSVAVPAYGVARGAAEVHGTLDGTPLSGIAYNPLAGDGRWSVTLNLAPASHTLNVAASSRFGGFTSTASSTFTVTGADSITNLYDGGGYVVGRSMTNGAQLLKWDGAGRLIGISFRDAQTNGYDWTAIYDGLGRRLRTTHATLAGGVVSTNPTVIDSFYDPEIEFLEVGVALNGARTWKIYGPDLDGTYGGAQGLGGLEATVWEPSGAVTPVLLDHFGHAPATVQPQNGAVTWNAARVDGAGPLLGYAAPVFGSGLTLAEASPWRGKRIDPTGLYWLGARYYEPLAGRFLSPDPGGHEGSFDLYSFADGDPVNQFDPDGRFARGFREGIELYVNGLFNDGLGFLANLGVMSPLTQARLSAPTHEPGYYNYPSEAYEAGVFAGYDALPTAAVLASMLIMPGGGGGLGAVESAGLRAGTRLAGGRLGSGAVAGVGAGAAGRAGFGGLAAAEMSAAGVGANAARVFGLRSTADFAFDRMTLGAARGREIAERFGSAGLARTVQPTSLLPTSIRSGADPYGGFKEPTGHLSYSPNAPLFVGVPNWRGGRTWISTGEVKQRDFAPLVEAGMRRGQVTLLTGVHGVPIPTEKRLISDRGLFLADLDTWRNHTDRVKIIDMTRVTREQAAFLLHREGRVICTWCWGHVNPVIRQMLRNPFKPQE